MELVRGYRGKLEGNIDVSRPFTVRMETSGSAVYDSCCFGVDASDKLSDDRYMVFYNQTASPAGEITYAENGGSGEYTVSLTALPQSIAKLVFTVSIDGEGTMGQIQSHRIIISQNGGEVMRLTLGGADFGSEKAIIGIEIYMKTVWRLAVVASGFNGGLSDLLANYGGELADEPEQAAAPAAAATPAPTPAAQPVSQSQAAAPAVHQSQPQQSGHKLKSHAPILGSGDMPEPVAINDFRAPEFRAVPFNTVPLPMISAPAARPFSYDTQPLPTGKLVEEEKPFTYTTTPLP